MFSNLEDQIVGFETDVKDLNFLLIILHSIYLDHWFAISKERYQYLAAALTKSIALNPD